MITREAQDRYHIQTIGGEIDLQLSGAELRERLHKTGLWVREQIEAVLAMEVGDQTARPRGAMIERDKQNAVHTALGKYRAEEELRYAYKHDTIAGFWGSIVERHLRNEVKLLPEHQKERVIWYRDYTGTYRYDFRDGLDVCVSVEPRIKEKEVAQNDDGTRPSS